MKKTISGNVYSLSGVVLDNVEVIYQDITLATDKNGYYSIDIKEDVTNIRFVKEGYFDYFFELNYSLSNTKNIKDVVMKNIVNSDTDLGWYNDYYVSMLSGFVLENLKLNNNTKKIALVGDSITEIMPLDDFNIDGYEFVKRGISGDTTKGISNRIGVSSYHFIPEVVVMLGGINDLNLHKPHNYIIENWRDIFNNIKAYLPNSIIIIQSTYLLNSKTDLPNFQDENKEVNQLNILLKQLVESFGYYYLDMNDYISDLSINQMIYDYSDDGIHPNNKGYKVICRVLQDKINELLKNK